MNYRGVTIFLLAGTFVLLLLGCFSGRDIYDVEGAVENRSAQGMAIYGDRVFLANNGGLCRIYDLKKKVETSRFMLASQNKNNHCNCFDFGTEYPAGNHEYPALYVSECTSPGRCFVESVSHNGSTLIQTISLRKRVTSWFVDRNKNKLYAMAHVTGEKGKKDSVVIYRFALPPIKKRNVLLENRDVEDSIRIKVPYALQGGTIHKNRLYLPVGTYDDIKKGNRRPRKILVVDLTQKTILRTIDMEEEFKNEPEDVNFYRGRLWVFCGQSGGLYSIRIK